MCVGWVVVMIGPSLWFVLAFALFLQSKRSDQRGSVAKKPSQWSHPPCAQHMRATHTHTHASPSFNVRSFHAVIVPPLLLCFVCAACCILLCSPFASGRWVETIPLGQAQRTAQATQAMTDNTRSITQHRHPSLLSRS